MRWGAGVGGGGGRSGRRGAGVGGGGVGLKKSRLALFFNLHYVRVEKLQVKLK